MKKLLLLLALPLVMACSKDKDNNIDNTGKTLQATYTFHPGLVTSDVGYYSQVDKANRGQSDITTLKNFTDVVKKGDNIKLWMNTTKEPKGNFDIRLTINGKLVSEVSGKDGERNIQLHYTVTDKDFQN
ncbi:hypothetical protein ORI89_18660 [Sphingobacterium sp. UT-1RO-CII-1]|uniref:hypothetical protein n=1 Tax=Sphingobacterium sp. UT-1RO-CII-1 TaxID=2995225 RepID=UPI00227C391C|nr:hypothetical protein [Sphingobacterium sp. UT-1RO-CII-1]MCY4781679.1 hypothetical protein [Sphingobacterium sp. UT-1RO-CII-1]